MKNISIKVLIIFLATSSINFAQWQPTSGPEAGHITSIISFNSNLICGTLYGDIFTSTDDGSSWNETGTVEVAIPAGDALTSIAGNSSALFAGTFTNLFRSIDAGVNWNPVINNIHVEKIIVVNENIFVAAQNGAYTSIDNGLNWLNITSDLPDSFITSISSHGPDLFAAVSGSGIYRSTNNGANWHSVNTGLTTDEINFITSDGTKLYAAFSGKAEIFYSSDNGNNWHKSDLIGGSLAFETVLSLFASPDAIYAGVIYQASIFSSISGGVYKSTDGGVNWEFHSTGLTNAYVRSLYHTGSSLLAGTQKGGIFKSPDNGVTWSPSNNGLLRAEVRHISFTNNGADFFAGVYGGGFYTSNDSGKTWTADNNEIGFSAFPAVTQFLIKGSFWFIATDGDGIFRSSDNGATWTAVNTFLDNRDIIALITRGNDLIAGSGSGVEGIYRSTDNGDTWINIAQGTFIIGVGSLTAGGAGTIFAGGGFGSAGVMRTTNNGANWLQSTGLPGVSVTALRFIGTKMFAGTAGEGVYISNDFGVTWAPSNTGMENAEVTFIAIQDTMNIFASTRNHGIFRSTDNGLTWNQINEGLPTNSIWSVRITSTHIYAGTNGYSVWRRHLSDITTDIGETTDNNFPSNFNLFQNYPNPFNPTTKIEYFLPAESNVKISVFNILGEKVRELVNSKMSAGLHSVNFNASILTSGIYFYQIEAKSISGAQNFVAVKKMILLK